MASTFNHKWSGKARAAFKRSRAVRLADERRIREYLSEPQSDRPALRHYRVEHRYEFKPTTVAALSVDDEPAVLRGAQLDLPLRSTGTGQPQPCESHMGGGVPSRKCHTVTVTREQDSTGPDKPKPAVAVTSVRKGAPPAFLPFPKQKPRGALSWRGFLYGCALGGAAAAFLLAILSIVTR